jgi:hypothetical protein
MGKITTNATEAKENKLFIAACKIAGVVNTSRQMSKWRNKKGSAYQARFKAVAKRG